jgi:hypothetical protein
MYHLIFDVIEELSPGLQVIITDHAKFEEDERFLSWIKHELSGEENLVPEEWPVGISDI